MRLFQTLLGLFALGVALPSEHFDPGLSLSLIKSDLDEVLLCHQEVEEAHQEESSRQQKPFLRLDVLGSKILFKHSLDGQKHIFETHGKVTVSNEYTQDTKTTVLKYSEGTFLSQDLSSFDDLVISSFTPFGDPPEGDVLELSYTSVQEVRNAVSAKFDTGEILHQHLSHRFKHTELGWSYVEDQLQVGSQLLTAYYSMEPLYYQSTQSDEAFQRTPINIGNSIKAYIPKEVKMVLHPRDKRRLNTARFPGLVYDTFEQGFLGPAYTWFLAYQPRPENEMLGFRPYPFCHKILHPDAAISHLSREVAMDVSWLSRDMMFVKPSCQTNHLGVIKYTETSEVIVFCQRENRELCGSLQAEGWYCLKSKFQVNGNDAQLLLTKSSGFTYFSANDSHTMGTRIGHRDGTVLRVKETNIQVPSDAVIEKLIDYVEIPKLEKTLKDFNRIMKESICGGKDVEEAVVLYYRGVKAVFRCSAVNIVRLLYLGWYGTSAVVDAGDFTYDTLKVLEGNVTYNTEKEIFYSDDRMFVGVRAIFVRSSIDDDHNIEIPDFGLKKELEELHSRVTDQWHEHRRCVLSIGNKDLIAAESASKSLGSRKLVRFTGKFKKVSLEKQTARDERKEIFFNGTSYVSVHADGSTSTDENAYEFKYGFIEKKDTSCEIHFAKLTDVNAVVRRTSSELHREYCDDSVAEVVVDIQLKKGHFLTGKFHCKTRSFETNRIKSTAIVNNKTLQSLSGKVEPFEATMTFTPDVHYVQFHSDPIDIYAYRILENTEWNEENKAAKSFKLVVGATKGTYSYYVRQ